VGESLAWKSADYGLDVLCIRPFSGYGPGQDFDYPVPSIVRRILQKEDPITIWGDTTRDFVYVTDIVKATFARLRAGVSGYEPMNICSGNGLSFRDLAHIVSGITGHKADVVSDGSKPVGVQRRIGDPTYMRRFHSPEVAIGEGLKRVIADVEGR
jgi:GDP-L-fucose synthase